MARIVDARPAVPHVVIAPGARLTCATKEDAEIVARSFPGSTVEKVRR